MEILNLKEKLIRFMQGRYGSYGQDSLNRFLLYVAIGTMLLSFFFRGGILYFITLAALGFSYFRMLSRNVAKRSKENQIFQGLTADLRNRIKKGESKMKQSRTHHIYKCPSCGQKIRIPRGKGKIAIRCPQCSNEFIKKS